MSEPRTHPNGVVIPPSPGDANYESDRTLLDGSPLTCSSEFNRGYDAGYLAGMKVPVVEVPRWDEDPVVIANEWVTGRCGKCGELNLPDAPMTPHTPTSAPNTPPRGLVNPDTTRSTP